MLSSPQGEVPERSEGEGREPSELASGLCPPAAPAISLPPPRWRGLMVAPLNRNSVNTRPLRKLRSLPLHPSRIALL